MAQKENEAPKYNINTPNFWAEKFGHRKVKLLQTEMGTSNFDAEIFGQWRWAQYAGDHGKCYF